MSEPKETTENIQDQDIKKINDNKDNVDEKSADVSNLTTNELTNHEIESNETDAPMMHCEETNNDVTVNNDSTESDQFIENEPTLCCKLCDVKNCPMWRRGDGRTIICNLCHLKRQKALSTNMKTIQTNSNHKMIKDGHNNIRTSTRKNKAKKKFPNSIYNERIIKNGNVKSRRNLCKKRPLKSVEDGPSVVATSSVYHDGILFQVGDIVSTIDMDGGRYFAQIRGFLQDSYCEKCVAVTWLIPLRPNQHLFDPMLFTPGYDEGKARPMSSFNFVCRAPTDLYKSRILHPPLQKKRANLENLFTAANSALQVEN